MATFMEMSLEDIINKKKKQNATKINNRKSNPPSRIVDARNRIISKKRTQITDAREILTDLAKQKDARLKLQQLRAKRQVNHGSRIGNEKRGSGQFVRTLQKEGRVFMDHSRQVTSQLAPTVKSGNRNQINAKNKFLESRSIAARMPLIKPIVRTVENDLQIIDEPMEEDYAMTKVELSDRRASLQLRITAQNNYPYTKSTVHRTASVPKEKSPPRPPSILKKRPMAALRNEQKVEKPDKPVLEYRIIVSNLRSSVTGGDIEELFGDVGGMVESRLVRPGTAEVMYKTLEDAQRAVDLYHNRQLDGQPMNCLLVTPRATATSAKNSKPLYNSSSIIEPDISTFHKVLFSNF